MVSCVNFFFLAHTSMCFILLATDLRTVHDVSHDTHLRIRERSASAKSCANAWEGGVETRLALADTSGVEDSRPDDDGVLDTVRRRAFGSA